MTTAEKLPDWMNPEHDAFKLGQKLAREHDVRIASPIGGDETKNQHHVVLSVPRENAKAVRELISEHVSKNDLQKGLQLFDYLKQDAKLLNCVGLKPEFHFRHIVEGIRQASEK